MGKQKSRSNRKRQLAMREERRARWCYKRLSPELRFVMDPQGLPPDLIEATRRIEKRARRVRQWGVGILEAIGEYRLAGKADAETVNAMECARGIVTAPLVALAEDLNSRLGQPLYGVSSSIEWEPEKNPRIVVEVGRYRNILREGGWYFEPSRHCEIGRICYREHYLQQWKIRVLGTKFRDRSFGWNVGHAPLLPGHSIEYRPTSGWPDLLTVLLPFAKSTINGLEPDVPGRPETVVHIVAGYAPFRTLGDGMIALTTFLPPGAHRTPGSTGWLEGEQWEQVMPRLYYTKELPDDFRFIWDYSRLLPRRKPESLTK